MGSCGKNIRLRRILGPVGHRALVVAFDHALVLGPIPGTENPLAQIRRFAEACADAVLLNLGLIRQCTDAALPTPLPPLIARIDWTTVWTAMGNGVQGELRSCLLARPEDALRHGADAVLTYMVVGTGDADFESKEVARTAEVARECERIGIPLIVESLARGQGVTNPADPKWITMHSRMALELGADAVKTDYSGDPQTMRSIVEGCPIPILVLGGAKQASERDALEVVRGAAMAGAAGVFFGRNVFQAPDMKAFLQEARAVLDQTEAAARR